MLGCLLFKKFKKFDNTYCFSRAARISSRYLRLNLGLLRLNSFNHLDS